MVDARFYDELQVFYTRIHSCRERRRQLMKAQSDLMFVNLSRSKNALVSTRQAQRWANHKRLELLYSRLIECERRLKLLYNRMENSKLMHSASPLNSEHPSSNCISLSVSVAPKDIVELTSQWTKTNDINHESKMIKAVHSSEEHHKELLLETSQSLRGNSEKYSEMLEQSTEDLTTLQHLGTTLLLIPKRSPQPAVQRAKTDGFRNESENTTTTAPENIQPAVPKVQLNDEKWDDKGILSETDTEFTMSALRSSSYSNPYSNPDEPKLFTKETSIQKISTSTQKTITPRSIETKHNLGEPTKAKNAATGSESDLTSLSPGLIPCTKEAASKNALAEYLTLDNTSLSSATPQPPSEKQMAYQNFLLKTLGSDIKDMSSAGEQTEELEFGEAILKRSAVNPSPVNSGGAEKPNASTKTNSRLLSAYLNGCDSEEDSFYD